MRIKFFQRTLVILSIAVFVFSVCTAKEAQKQGNALSPEDIVALCRSGTSESSIISTLQDRGVNFEMNVPVMQKLVDGGVSPGIIEVILSLSGTKGKAVSVIPQNTIAGLTLVTDPPGMKITIDGAEKGVTPFFSNKLKHEKHIVRVAHPLFFMHEEEIDLTDGKPVYLDWEMKPREPIIRVKCDVKSEKDTKPWSWIIRPRKNCPGGSSLELIPWKEPGADSMQAVFILSDDFKRIYSGHGSACLEVFLWRGKIRDDLPLERLPPSTVRLFISNIVVNGIENIDLTLKIDVPQYDPNQPRISLEGDTGNLVLTKDKAQPESPETLQDDVLKKLDMMLENN